MKAIPRPLASEKSNSKSTNSKNTNYVSVLENKKSNKILISLITDRRLRGWQYLVLKANQQSHKSELIKSQDSEKCRLNARQRLPIN